MRHLNELNNFFELAISNEDCEQEVLKSLQINDICSIQLTDNVTDNFHQVIEDWEYHLYLSSRDTEIGFKEFSALQERKLPITATNRMIPPDQ
ncbi:hypothetical protein BXY85_3532 [Roseivirga pacifica]|uniref:Uncharacterized protein n=1 Tax=Roseivirga pacifica TaxID=1267423 RepID=A0A1I0QII4_9BACT|nr:hypothetical protein [Roseivirga pacifica]RKQ42915.1 hypothetical protein BXY85_3532 [Roseivirga pacifica]SEW26461.1 hypothetical protein SAMN05216290_2343 [Roseivirga pacifica]